MKECVEAGLQKTQDIETSGALKYPRKAFSRFNSALKAKKNSVQ